MPIPDRFTHCSASATKRAVQGHGFRHGSHESGLVPSSTLHARKMKQRCDLSGGSVTQFDMGVWSDGAPVTAHDFTWSFARQLDPASGAAYAGFLFDIKNAEAFNTGKITERWRRPTFGSMQIDVTIEDPKAYTKPFTIRVNHRLMPDTELMEFVCEERDAVHYLGKK